MFSLGGKKLRWWKRNRTFKILFLLKICNIPYCSMPTHTHPSIYSSYLYMRITMSYGFKQCLIIILFFSTETLLGKKNAKKTLLHLSILFVHEVLDILVVEEELEEKMTT